MVMAGESKIGFIKTGMPWGNTMEELEEPVRFHNDSIKTLSARIQQMFAA